jgi:hypothetical protein
MQCLVLPKLEGGGGERGCYGWDTAASSKAVVLPSVSMARASGDVHRVVHKTAPRARF